MKKVLIILLGLISTNIMAKGSSGYISLSDKAIQIISGSSPRVFVYNAEIQNSGCGKNSIPVLLMDSSETLGKEMYAMLLAAKSSGKKVNLVTDGCWVNGDYPKIMSIYWNN